MIGAIGTCQVPGIHFANERERRKYSERRGEDVGDGVEETDTGARNFFRGKAKEEGGEEAEPRMK